LLIAALLLSCALALSLNPGLVVRHFSASSMTLALQIVAWLAAGLLAWSALALAQQKRQMRRLAHRVSADLGNGAWQDAVQSLRDERLAAPSAFDTLATGFEEVLGESERRWQTLADLAADWYWETDRQHRLAWMSGAGPLIASQGLRPSDLVGRRHDQITDFEPPADGWAAWHATLDAGRSFRDLEFQVRLAGQPDARAWVAISGRPRRDAAGRLLGYEGVGRDITQRKQADASLRSSEQRWSLMAGLANDYYWETDTEHRLQPLRHEVARRFGPLADVAEGRTPWEAFPDAMDRGHWDEYRADIAARRPFQAVEFDIDIGDDRRRLVALSGIPRFDGQGAFLGYHGIGRDITMRREAERLLMRHNETLQRAVAERTDALERVNHDLDAFARQLAHELRTPIAHVRGLTQLMETRLKEQLGADGQMLIDMQLRATQHMQETVDALLLLARSTMQAMPMQAVDLTAMAREVIAELPHTPREAPIRWQVTEGLRAHAAPAALRIVLANLLGNAAKFTREVEQPQVWVDGRPDPDGRLRLMVRDNGAGFDANQAGRLFLPFSRLHSTERFGGTGIGLTIVQRIIERHGGSVRATGAVGQGAQFELTLPAADSQPGAYAEPAAASPATEPSGAAAARTNAVTRG
jgi:PAS domain S-box-containing protein